MRSTPDAPSGGAPAPPEGCVRIVSWNCQGGIPRKAAVLAALAPDVAVIPEAGPTALRGASPEWARHRRYAASLLAAIERHCGDVEGPLVVAGDFNTAAVLDDGRGLRAHRDVVDALAARGLTSAWHHLAGRAHGDDLPLVVDLDTRPGGT